jgi:hypothetical protein
MATQDNKASEGSSDDVVEEGVVGVQQEESRSEKAASSSGEVSQGDHSTSVDPTTVEIKRPSGQNAQVPRWRFSAPESVTLPARLHRIRLTAQGWAGSATNAVTGVIGAGSRAETTPAEVDQSKRRKERKRRKSKRNALEGWQNWSKFRLWRRTRPLAGSILIILSASLMLATVVFFLPLAFLMQSLWPAFVISGILLVMGLIPLFLPSYAVVTGSISIVLSLASLLVASFGGFGIGMMLGLIGSALTVAWRPVKPARLLAARSAKVS